MEIPWPKNWFTLVKITICLSKNSFQKSYNTKNVMAELSKKAHSQQQKRKLLYGGQERTESGIKKGARGSTWQYEQNFDTGGSCTSIIQPHTHTHTQSQGSSLNDPTTLFQTSSHPSPKKRPGSTTDNGIMIIFF